MEHMHRRHPMYAVDGGHDCMDQHKLQSQRVQRYTVQLRPHSKSHNAQPIDARTHSSTTYKTSGVSTQGTWGPRS